MIPFTLKWQVRNAARWHGWPESAAECVADLAASEYGNWPVLPQTLRRILREVMRSDGN